MAARRHQRNRRRDRAGRFGKPPALRGAAHRQALQRRINVPRPIGRTRKQRNRQRRSTEGWRRHKLERTRCAQSSRPIQARCRVRHIAAGNPWSCASASPPVAPDPGRVCECDEPSTEANGLPGPRPGSRRPQQTGFRGCMTAIHPLPPSLRISEQDRRCRSLLQSFAREGGCPTRRSLPATGAESLRGFPLRPHSYRDQLGIGAQSAAPLTSCTGPRCGGTLHPFGEPKLPSPYLSSAILWEPFTCFDPLGVIRMMSPL